MQLRSLNITPTELTISECQCKEEIEKTYPITRQLRPHLMLNNYLRLVDSLMKHENFRLFAAYNQDHHCVGVVGFQELQRLAFGKIIYVADLVTDRDKRSQGIGKQLLDRVKEEAKLLKINAIVLESKVDRTKAHSFYQRYGFKMNAYGFRLFSPFKEDEMTPLKIIKLDEEKELAELRSNL